LVRPPASHCRDHTRQVDLARGSARERGYNTAQWRSFRAHWLAVHPWCGDRQHGTSDHSRCATDKLRVLATDVDHIERVTGPDDPRFYDPMAVQSLCHSCHARKTRKEQRP
jgi:5-methylcytosine-specific restriction protein A